MRYISLVACVVAMLVVATTSSLRAADVTLKVKVSDAKLLEAKIPGAPVAEFKIETTIKNVGKQPIAIGSAGFTYELRDANDKVLAGHDDRKPGIADAQQLEKGASKTFAVTYSLVLPSAPTEKANYFLTVSFDKEKGLAVVRFKK